MTARLAALAALAAAALAAPPERVLILTGESDTQYHDWRVTTPFIEQVLQASGRFETRVEAAPRGITRETLSGYKLVVVNYNGPRWGATAEQALEEYVRDGGGLLSFHGVTYGPLMEWPQWSEMVGATWAVKDVGHAPRGAFTVKTKPHAISQGMAGGFMVNDELYHKLVLRPSVEVVATAFDDAERGGTGRDEPMAWVRSYGKGRTFHTTLGHDTSALYQPQVMALLARGAEWAATGEVTIAPAIHLHQAAKDSPRVLVVTGGHSYTPSFYSIFESYPDIRWQHAASQQQAFNAKLKDNYDVVVLYDMANELGEAEQKNLRAFVEAGKGVVALHHSIVDYTSWPWWWQEVIGGKYFEKPLEGHAASQYKEGVPMVLHAAKGQQRHPILRGVGDLVTVDECYRGMWHSPKITVLMEMADALNDVPVVYLGPNPNYRAVYIQLGHGAETHYHPGYRKLVHNAILWAAGK